MHRLSLSLCTRGSGCVMNFALDALETALGPVLATVIESNIVLWGEACLDDVQAAAD